MWVTERMSTENKHTVQQKQAYLHTPKKPMPIRLFKGCPHFPHPLLRLLLLFILFIVFIFYLYIKKNGFSVKKNGGISASRKHRQKIRDIDKARISKQNKNTNTSHSIPLAEKQTIPIESTKRSIQKNKRSASQNFKYPITSHSVTKEPLLLHKARGFRKGDAPRAAPFAAGLLRVSGDTLNPPVMGLTITINRHGCREITDG